MKKGEFKKELKEEYVEAGHEMFPEKKKAKAKGKKKLCKHCGKPC
jgi:hypothetical protein